MVSSSAQAARSARPTASGTHGSGPNGIPSVRDHSHSSRGPAETASAIGSAQRRRVATRAAAATSASVSSTKNPPAAGHSPRCSGTTAACTAAAPSRPATSTAGRPAHRCSVAAVLRPRTANRPPRSASSQKTATTLDASRINDPRATARTWSRTVASNCLSRQAPVQSPPIEPIVSRWTSCRRRLQIESATRCAMPASVDASATSRAGRTAPPRRRPVPRAARDRATSTASTNRGSSRRRVAQPADERGGRALRRPHGAAQRGHPEPVHVGQDHRERKHRAPRHGSSGLLDPRRCSDRLDAHGVISQPNIIAWSSCARLWQCAT